VWPLRVLIIEEVPAAPELLATGTLSTTPALTITQVFTQATVPNEPALGWVDLSAWAGRDITVTFELYPDPERQGVSVLLDVISLTPWETPVVYGAALAAEAPTQAQNATATLVITGENFITTPTVSLVTDITTTVPLTLAAPAAETELRVVWPSGHTPGIYRVRVTNPGGIYNEFAFAINLAEVNFLPIAVK
jgi:hypothetical protein